MKKSAPATSKKKVSQKQRKLNLLALRRKIRKDNHRYRAASPAQKRVMIAKDILKWLAMGLFTAKRENAYLCLPGFDTYSSENRDVQLDDALLSSPTCEVCARGAFFAAHILRTDNITCGKMGDVNDVGKQSSYLEADGVLERDDFRHEMEGEFESGGHRSGKEALVDICERIIKNKGHKDSLRG